IFSAFGELEEVVVAPVAAHARKRDPESASALLVFKSVASAHALMNTKHRNAQLDAFSRFWAAGSEPRAVQDILGANRSSGEHTMGAGNSAVASASFGLSDADAIDLRAIPGIDMSFADFEALTLMRMRQHGGSSADGSLAQ
ncbi:hypothetical protein LPJ56_007008, partial [Coemansia sp. RSA 2599]